MLKEIQGKLGANQPVVIGEGGGKTPLHLRPLQRLAAIKSNRLGIFANAHQAKTKIRLAPQLVEIEQHQALAKAENDDASASHGIRHQEKHQLMRDRPEHGTKGNQLQG